MGTFAHFIDVIDILSRMLNTNKTVLNNFLVMAKNDKLVESDYVLTPEWCAKDIMEYFAPTGKMLDPCRGLNKVFHNQMPKDADWCEIQEGNNFFEYTEKVDWIVGNPPYSIFHDWMEHSFAIADNIVYLLPTFKIFNALGLCRMYGQNGWIKHIRFYDTGRKIEWSRSRPIVAVHFQKNYFGDTSWSYYDGGKKLFKTEPK